MRERTHWAVIYDIIQHAARGETEEALKFAEVLAIRLEEDGDIRTAHTIRRAMKPQPDGTMFYPMQNRD